MLPRVGEGIEVGREKSRRVNARRPALRPCPSVTYAEPDTRTKDSRAYGGREGGRQAGGPVKMMLFSA